VIAFGVRRRERKRRCRFRLHEARWNAGGRTEIRGTACRECVRAPVNCPALRHK
jgi:hypothetical protein